MPIDPITMMLIGGAMGGAGAFLGGKQKRPRTFIPPGYDEYRALTENLRGVSDIVTPLAKALAAGSTSQIPLGHPIFQAAYGGLGANAPFGIEQVRGFGVPQILEARSLIQQQYPALQAQAAADVQTLLGEIEGLYSVQDPLVQRTIGQFQQTAKANALRQLGSAVGSDVSSARTAKYVNELAQNLATQRAGQRLGVLESGQEIQRALGLQQLGGELETLTSLGNIANAITGMPAGLQVSPPQMAQFLPRSGTTSQAVGAGLAGIGGGLFNYGLQSQMQQQFLQGLQGLQAGGLPGASTLPGGAPSTFSPTSPFGFGISPAFSIKPSPFAPTGTSMNYGYNPYGIGSQFRGPFPGAGYYGSLFSPTSPFGFGISPSGPTFPSNPYQQNIYPGQSVPLY